MITHLRTVYVREIPDALQEGVFYLSKQYELALHLCACECKREVVTPLAGDNRRSIAVTANGVSFTDAVNSKRWPCKSHYWVKEGIVQPCSDHGV